MKKHIIIGTLFALVLLASVARASETVERTDLADIFQGFDGTFIMYDEGADRYTVFNKALSETRLPPCSTFKVFHALIGLDSGRPGPRRRPHPHEMERQALFHRRVEP